MLDPTRRRHARQRHASVPAIARTLAVCALGACAPRTAAPVAAPDRPEPLADAIELRVQRAPGSTRRFALRTISAGLTTTAGVLIETLGARPDGGANRRLRFESFDVSPLAGAAAQLLEPLRVAMLRSAVDFAEDARGVPAPRDEATTPTDPFDAAARSLAGNVLTLLPQLPDHAVRTGDRWTGALTTRLRTTQVNSTTDYQWTYTLARVVGPPAARIAEIDVAEVSVVRSENGITGRGEAHGLVRFDVGVGDVSSVQIAGDLALHGAQPGDSERPPSHHEFELRARGQ